MLRQLVKADSLGRKIREICAFFLLYLNFNSNCSVTIILKHPSLLSTYSDENFIFLTAFFELSIVKGILFLSCVFLYRH